MLLVAVVPRKGGSGEKDVKTFSESTCVSPAYREWALKVVEINKLSPSNSFFPSRDLESYINMF